jgi:hypothetical protein
MLHAAVPDTAIIGALIQPEPEPWAPVRRLF